MVKDIHSPENCPITTALLSVTDKTGLVEFATSLVTEFNIKLIASGGTAQALIAANLPVTQIDSYTQSPEMFGGRVKTLHPRIHGGILFKRNDTEHQAQAKANNVAPIDLVVVNLYAFKETIAQAGITPPQAIEQIDIGGPALLRSSAKNHESVTVVPSPKYYNKVLNNLRDNSGSTTLELRQALAKEVFAITCAYDATIADYFSKSIVDKDIQ